MKMKEWAGVGNIKLISKLMNQFENQIEKTSQISLSFVSVPKLHVHGNVGIEV